MGQEEVRTAVSSEQKPIQKPKSQSLAPTGRTDIGAKLKKEIEKLEELQEEYTGAQNKATDSKSRWLTLEKKIGPVKAEIAFLKEQIPALQHDIGMFGRELADSRKAKRRGERKVRRQERVTRGDDRKIRKFDKLLVATKESAASAVRRVKRAEKRVHSSNIVKETSRRKKFAKTQAALKAT